MTLDYPSLPFEDLPHFKGGEKKLRAQIFWDGKVKILHGILEPGASIGEHLHETNAEVIFVRHGKGTIIDDGEKSPICAGQCTYCPQGHSHSLVNTGQEDLEFYATIPELK